MSRLTPLLLGILFPAMALHAEVRNYVEVDGIVAVEAEHFVAQSKDPVRRWYVTTQDSLALDLPDPDGNHAGDASGGAYIEILPDNRTTHDEKLIHYTDDKTDANFAPVPGSMGVLSYPIYFNTAGIYVFWARAYSTGPEDNGLHVGIDGTWPESSSRVQLCPGKHQWTWSSAQRRSHNHCGDPRTILVSVPSPGMHLITLSMREDGFELDKFILTRDFSFEPSGMSIPAGIRSETEPSRGKTFVNLPPYDFQLNATTQFLPTEGGIPYYLDRKHQALAINAAIREYRDTFAAVRTRFTGQPGNYSFTLISLTEIDGESKYQVSVDGTVLKTLSNPVGAEDYHETQLQFGQAELRSGSEITVEFMAATNGKIPENGETAYSRGRWRGLILTAVE